MARLFAWILRFMVLAVLAGICIYVVNNFLAYRVSLAKFTKARPAELSPIPRDARVVVVAPHPDDEALALAGWLTDGVERGAKIYAIVMTNGDAFTLEARQFLRRFDLQPKDYLRNGILRQRETLRASKALGYQENVVFLGYPDQGIYNIWESYWTRPYTSPTTKVDRVPYKRSFRRGSPYEGRVIAEQLAKLFVRLKPDVLVIPSRFETHPDHYAANLYSTMALTSKEIKKQPLVCEYVVHRGGYPYPYGLHPYAFLSPPEGLLNVGLDWRSFTLDDRAKAKKARALMQYRSQFFFAAYDIAGFYRRNEVSSRGKNVYQVTDVSNKKDILTIRSLPPGARDPIGDTTGRLLEPAGDVMMIRVLKNDRPMVLVTVNAKVSDAVSYQIDVRDIRDGRLIKSDKFKYPKGAGVEASGKNIKIMLPNGYVTKGSLTFVEVATRSSLNDIDSAASFFEERK